MTDKVKEIMTQLEDGVAAVFTSEKYIRLLNMLAQFHRYSYRCKYFSKSDAEISSRIGTCY